MLTEKIKRLTERLLDKHATVQSVAEYLGPWKNNPGSSECELTPRDGDFRSGYIEIDSEQAHAHLPVGARRPVYLDLTLAKDAVLTIDALERVFGRRHPVTPPPHGNPYSVSFYYPNDKALLSVWITVELSGPAEDAATKATSITLHRNDFSEGMHKD